MLQWCIVTNHFRNKIERRKEFMITQTPFQTYKLSKEIQEALKLLGYDEPTPIQQEVIPLMLAGENVVAKAPTGSGKTAAFAIPICEHTDWDENMPQALVLEPTRELAEQVKDEIFRIGRKKRLKVPALFGGFPIDKQIQTLRQKSHIVVGTPGRVADHLRRESLRLDKVKYVVIDEADLMLDMGFADEVGEILSLLKEECRISLFSATLKPEIQELADMHIQDARLIMQEKDEAMEDAITQVLYETDKEGKYDTFIRVLKEENPACCIIFCGTKEMVNVLFQKLRRNRIFCGMLHGDMDQRERMKTVDAFRRGGFRFLIATDVAARGVDFDGITHVVNYDFPTGRETYVHRIGRTGRNGHSGRAISLICEEDRRMLRMVEEFMGQVLPVTECPAVSTEAEQVFWKAQRQKAAGRPRKGDALNKGILRLSIGGGRKSKLRPGDIVGTICSIESVSEEDIGIIDIRDSLSYVEILNDKGLRVFETLQTKPIKGKVRKVRKTRL